MMTKKTIPGSRQPCRPSEGTSETTSPKAADAPETSSVTTGTTTGNAEIADYGLKLKIGGQSPVDKAIMWNRERPPSQEELSGCGKPKRRRPSKYPFIKISMPDKGNGTKGVSVVLGVKGTF